MKTVFKYVIMLCASLTVSVSIYTVCLIGGYDYTKWLYLNGYFACMAWYQTGIAFDHFTKSK